MGRVHSSGRHDLGRVALRASLWLLLALFIAADLRIVWEIVRHRQVGIDFLPLWTGARVDPARVYDFAYVTAEQAGFYQGKIRPFIYPPTALLFLKPLGWLGFWPALTVVVTSSAALFVAASRRIGADWRVVLIPPVVFVVAVGQLTLLVGALVMLGLTLSPVMAGVAFGVAGAIKPQMLVFLPLALIIDRNFKAFLVTGITAALLVAASLLTDASWTEWFGALPRFQALVTSDPTLATHDIAPYVWFGFPGLIGAGLLALVALWYAFRTDDPALKALALLGGAIAVSPYAMSYDLTLLGPPMLALLSRKLHLTRTDTDLSAPPEPHRY